MKEASARQIWIDLAKGIGIALVVAGHTGIPALATKYVSAFHMPLFFFLSGLLYKRRPVGETIARRTRTLIVPYFMFSLVGFAVYDGIIADSWQGLSHYGRELLGVLYGTPGGPYDLTVFPLWFLLSLFLAQVTFSFVLHVSHGRPMRAPVLISALAALGFLNSETLRFAAPWSAASALVGILFLALGYVCRRRTSQISAMSAWQKLIGVILLGGIVLATALTNQPVIMAHGSYGTVPLFLLGALSGIAMVLFLSMLVEDLYRLTARHALGASLAVSTRVLMYLGQNTLTILAMHVPAAALAAHWLAYRPALLSPVLNAVAAKILAGSLLLASIELCKRCPLVVPRKSMQAAASPL
jgi:acyltransferase